MSSSWLKLFYSEVRSQHPSHRLSLPIRLLQGRPVQVKLLRHDVNDKIRASDSGVGRGLTRRVLVGWSDEAILASWKNNKEVGGRASFDGNWSFSVQQCWGI